MRRLARFDGVGLKGETLIVSLVDAADRLTDEDLRQLVRLLEKAIGQPPS